MRVVAILVASTLAGLTLGIVSDAVGATAREGTMVAAARAGSHCGPAFCESIAWLRTPVMRRAGGTR